MKTIWLLFIGSLSIFQQLLWKFVENVYKAELNLYSVYEAHQIGWLSLFWDLPTQCAKSSSSRQLGCQRGGSARHFWHHCAMCSVYWPRVLFTLLNRLIIIQKKKGKNTHTHTARATKRDRVIQFTTFTTASNDVLG